MWGKSSHCLAGSSGSHRHDARNGIKHTIGCKNNTLRRRQERYLSGLSMTLLRCFFVWFKLRERFTPARAATQTATALHGSVWAASAVGMQWVCLPAVWSDRSSSWPHTPVKVVKLWPAADRIGGSKYWFLMNVLWQGEITKIFNFV